MFIFDVVLVAANVWALEGSRIGMRIQVVSEPSGAVEGFGTVGPCAGKSFEI